MNKFDEDEIQDDIYAFFNITREASNEEINNAFRRLSKIYHPDKHTDPELKQKAEQLFNKTKKYYDILIDEQKRALYDVTGGKILHSPADMQLVEVDKTGKRMTSEQIKSEYERLLKKQEEELLHQRTNPQGNITVFVNACNLFRPAEIKTLYGYDDEDDFRMPSITKLTIEQSVEAPASVNDRFMVGGSVTTEEGYGTGNMSLTWQRIVGRSVWAQTQVTVGDTLGAAFKFYGSLFKNLYGVAQFGLNVTEAGLAPSWVFGIHKQLEKHWVGSIAVNLSAQQTITTTLTYDDTFSKRFLMSFVIGRPSSFVLLSYTRRLRENDARIKAAFTYGTQGVSAQLGYHRKVSAYSDAGFTCRYAYPSGLTLKLRWVRANQQYSVNIKLCEEQIYPSAVLYAVVVPILILKNEKLTKTTASQDAKKKEAEITVRLMTSFAERVAEAEQAANGLVITEAQYGYFPALDGISPTSTVYFNTDNVADVRIPLQAMVKNSSLVLQESPKWQLAGFYDPCLGKEKLLRIVYNFNGFMHRVTIRDDEGLILPKTSHKVPDYQPDKPLFNEDISKDD